eukprot:1183522-Prorocentrum_minimum.AAC.3
MGHASEYKRSSYRKCVRSITLLYALTLGPITLSILQHDSRQDETRSQRFKRPGADTGLCYAHLLGSSPGALQLVTAGLALKRSCAT